MLWRNNNSRRLLKHYCSLPSTSFIPQLPPNYIRDPPHTSHRVQNFNFNKFPKPFPDRKDMDGRVPPLKTWEVQMNAPPFSWMAPGDALNYAKVIQSYFRTEISWNFKFRFLAFGAIESFDLVWMQVFKIHESVFKMFKKKYIKFKDFDSVYIWVNFWYHDKKRPKNLIESLQVYHKTPSIKNPGLMKIMKKYYYYWKYSKNLVDENIKIGARQAFHTIMTALRSGEMKNLKRCLLPGIAEDKITQLEGSLPVEDADDDYEVKNFSRLLKSISTSKTALLDFSSDDLLFIPETYSVIPFFNGRILWDITRKTLKFKDGSHRKYLVYTVPCVALYKKLKLYSWVGWKKLLPKDSLLPMTEMPKEYGFDRPMRAVAMIQFGNPYKDDGSLDDSVELFGFYLQVPTKKQEKSRLLNEEAFF